MSKVSVTDKRGGLFQVVMSFTYGECDRLPFNVLRTVGARIEQVQSGGITATADFNIRNIGEAESFVNMLDFFGEDGSYVHGSPADPEQLARSTVSEQVKPTPPPTPAATTTPSEEADDLEMESDQISTDDAEDLEIEGEGQGGTELDASINESLAANENRAEAIARVRAAAGTDTTEDAIRTRMITLLFEKYKDEAFVAASLRRRDWQEVSREEVAAVVKA